MKISNNAILLELAKTQFFRIKKRIILKILSIIWQALTKTNVTYTVTQFLSFEKTLEPITFI